jgi:hypothetical protein
LAAMENGEARRRDDLPASARPCPALATGWPRVAAIQATLDHRTNPRLADQLPASPCPARSQHQDV